MRDLLATFTGRTPTPPAEIPALPLRADESLEERLGSIQERLAELGERREALARELTAAIDADNDEARRRLRIERAHLNSEISLMTEDERHIRVTIAGAETRQEREQLEREREELIEAFRTHAVALEARAREVTAAWHAYGATWNQLEAWKARAKGHRERYGSAPALIVPEQAMNVAPAFLGELARAAAIAKGLDTHRANVAARAHRPQTGVASSVALAARTSIAGEPATGVLHVLEKRKAPARPARPGSPAERRA